MEQVTNRTAKVFNKVISQLGKYDHFKYEIKDNQLHLKGNLDTGYGPRNSFNIEIIVTDKYPSMIPQVHETDGRIPSIMDRHYMSDGTGCCLVMPHRYSEYFNSLMTFEDFIDTLVVPFFQNQIYYEINGCFVTGYKHGEYGVWEHYVEIFGNDLKVDTLTKLLEAVLRQRADKRIRIKGHKLCPCGSNLKQRRCHGAGLIQLKEHGDSVRLNQSLYYLQIQGLYRRIIRRELVESVNYGLKVQNIDPTKLPKISTGSFRMYDIVDQNKRP